MRTMSTVLLAVVLVVAITSSGSFASSPVNADAVVQPQPSQSNGPGGGMITGQVLGYDICHRLQPLDYANVTATNGQYRFVAYSGSGGYYEMVVPTGVYNVTATEAGYTAHSISVAVSDGSSSTINFYLESQSPPNGSTTCVTGSATTSTSTSAVGSTTSLAQAQTTTSSSTTSSQSVTTTSSYTTASSATVGTTTTSGTTTSSSTTSSQTSQTSSLGTTSASTTWSATSTSSNTTRTSGVATSVGFPFQGMKLVFYSETTPILQSERGISATGWAAFSFNDVTQASANITVAVNGTIVTNNEQTPVNLTLMISFPTDQDTLLYLRHGGQQDLTIYTAPADESFELIPGYYFNLTGTWNYLGRSPAATPVGDFTAYEYHISQTFGNTVLDFYAYYDVVTQVLVYGEVYATSGGFKVLIEKVTLRQDNFQSSTSANGSPKCIIATAAFGSELAGPVQFLRNFRDRDVNYTHLGSSFLSVFNPWYYSWAPTIAQAIAPNENYKAATRMFITPLIGTLIAGHMVFSALAPISPEVAILSAGLLTSAILGLLYLTPAYALAWKLSKRRITKRTLYKLVVVASALTFLATLTTGTVNIAANLSALAVVETLLLTPALVLLKMTSLINNSSAD